MRVPIVSFLVTSSVLIFLVFYESFFVAALRSRRERRAPY